MNNLFINARSGRSQQSGRWACWSWWWSNTTGASCGTLTWWRWVLNGFKTLKSGQYPDYQTLPAILIDQAWLWQKKPRDARILNFSNGLWALEIGSGANVEILCGWFRAWGSNITFLKITKMTSLFHNQWLNKHDIPTWILSMSMWKEMICSRSGLVCKALRTAAGWWALWSGDCYCRHCVWSSRWFHTTDTGNLLTEAASRMCQQYLI